MAKMIIGIIGAGGKTTAMKRLAREAGPSSVLVTTTTHIYPMAPPDCDMCLTDPDLDALKAALSSCQTVCAGSPGPSGKLASLPGEVLTASIQQANVVIYEGDGAHELPLKLHRSGEPVILPETDRCLIIAGLSALGQPVSEAVHRWTLRPEWEKSPGQRVSPEDLLYCVLETIRACEIPADRIRIFLNQKDCLCDAAAAVKIQLALEKLGFSVRSGSLKKDRVSLLDWIR